VTHIGYNDFCLGVVTIFRFISHTPSRQLTQRFCGEFNETPGALDFAFEEYAAIIELIAWKRPEHFFTHVVARVSFIREL
jgi:hypothetical protein